MTNTTVLRRMKVDMLNRKYRDEAHGQNELKRRISQAEAQLAMRLPGYQSCHGLNVVLRSVSGNLHTEPHNQARLAAIRAGPLPAAFKAEQQYLAEELGAALLEAEQMGKLQDNSQGTYDQVAQELEQMLVDENHADDGDEIMSDGVLESE